MEVDEAALGPFAKFAWCGVPLHVAGLPRRIQEDICRDVGLCEGPPRLAVSVYHPGCYLVVVVWVTGEESDTNERGCRNDYR